LAPWEASVGVCEADGPEVDNVEGGRVVEMSARVGVGEDDREGDSIAWGG
jgi:hypothetical protein